MSAAKAKRAKPGRAKAKSVRSVKSKSVKAKFVKSRPAKSRAARPKAGKPAAERAFRFTAADVVQIRFPGDKKPEKFRVDDMVEASLATLSGQAKHCYQYRLVSTDKTNPDGSERHFWFFDPKPVGVADTIDPSLWRPAGETAMDGYEVLSECSGNFSTRSVTSYDGSGARHIVRMNDTPAYRMRFDLNGKREFCDSVPVSVAKGDVLVVSDA
jgi:hypothetical protein